MAKIGVEESLTNIYDVLQEKGYDVIQLKQEQDAQNCDLCVMTGLDSNVMGIADTVIAGPVIEANGLSAEQVLGQIEQSLNR
ncbi:YkuS family protein [Bacillus marinisedimentorum]|uniref:YkuS family protein n=1 Tax=Bacillus marinisedimentorum TaxID=1821260 RepID=UPI000872094F|nr:YkuS family protein [Bacillus marinisedimentorum]